MEPIVSFDLDLLIFFRLFLAFFWGILLALFLQHHQYGRFLARRRTWIVVVIGVAADLAIAFPADWATVAGVFALSSIGVVVRSLVNEASEEAVLGRNKTIWVFEDLVVHATNLIHILDALLTEGNVGAAETRGISDALSLAYKIRHIIQSARKGEYIQS